jgi:hypothetical protein
MIARSQINLGKDLGFRQLIKQDIDVWQRILILDGNSIQRSIIHTHLQQLIFLLHKDSGTTPWR